MKRYLKYIFPFLASVLLAGCISEDDWDGRGGSGEETQVRITLKMPSSSVPTTRSISVTDENHVETIDVLVFKPVTPDEEHPSGWEFAYKAKGHSITDQPVDNPTKAKKQFTVTLLKDKDHEQALMFIANFDSYSISKGEDKIKAIKKLIVENAGSWNANNDNAAQEGTEGRFRPFPMWGELKATIDDATTSISGVSLLRSIARVDVALDDAVTNFALDEVYVYNSKSKGYVVPNPSNVTGDKVKAASTPIGADVNNDTPLRYEVPAGMEQLFDRTVYLFEAQAVQQSESSKATCLVIGGTLQGDVVPTYYRVDFFKKDSEGKPTGEYCDILRNHRYRINITKVSGKGYDTPEEAFNSKAINMVCEIMEWDDNTTDTDFNGQYHLSVDKNPVNLFGEESTGNKLLVKTDYPDGWTATIPNAADNWIEIQSQSYTELIFKVYSNMGGSDERRGIIRIKSGNLTKDVAVIQSNSREISLDIIQSGNQLTSLFFKSKGPTAQSYQVQWTPTDARCVMSISASKGGGLSFTLNAPTSSSQIQEIKPNDISSQEISSNPFIEKETVITYTIVDDVTGKSASKSIVLSQINYALIAGEYTTPYLMDGNIKKFMIRSNLAWKVEETSGSNVIESFTASEGEANVSGYNFTFRIVDRTSSTTIQNEIGQLCFTPRYVDSNKSFDDVIVSFKAITGLPFTYGGETYIADYTDKSPREWYSTAKKNCEKIGAGWRLPTESEFSSGAGFFFKDLSGRYWTSTSAQILSGHRVVYMPGRSSEDANDLSTMHNTRCVYGPVQ